MHADVKQKSKYLVGISTKGDYWLFPYGIYFKFAYFMKEVASEYQENKFQSYIFAVAMIKVERPARKINQKEDKTVSL